MFYNIFLKLCNDRGISPSAAALDMGFTKAANTKWAAGKTPRDATLAKIAEYFNVSVEYLKGEDGETDDRGQKKSPMPSDGAGDEVEHYFALLTPENQAYVKSVIAERLKEQLQGL